jgi:hypothetical protein
MLDMLADPDLCAVLAKRGQARLPQVFAPGPMIAATEALYQEIA